jgi:hypothetical protein
MPPRISTDSLSVSSAGRSSSSPPVPFPQRGPRVMPPLRPSSPPVLLRGPQREPIVASSNGGVQTGHRGMSPLWGVSTDSLSGSSAGQVLSSQFLLRESSAPVPIPQVPRFIPLNREVQTSHRAILPPVPLCDFQMVPIAYFTENQRILSVDSEELATRKPATFVFETPRESGLGSEKAESVKSGGSRRRSTSLFTCNPVDLSEAEDRMSMMSILRADFMEREQKKGVQQGVQSTQPENSSSKPRGSALRSSSAARPRAKSPRAHSPERDLMHKPFERTTGEALCMMGSVDQWEHTAWVGLSSDPSQFLPRVKVLGSINLSSCKETKRFEPNGFGSFLSSPNYNDHSSFLT